VNRRPCYAADKEVLHAGQTVSSVRGPSLIRSAGRRGASGPQSPGVRVHRSWRNTINSDLDLLVDTTGGTSLFDIPAIELELERLMGIPVHVTTPGALRGVLRERVLAEAEPV
jgi:hypothetical protein